MNEYYKSLYSNNEKRETRVIGCREEFEDLRVLAERLHIIAQELTESHLPLIAEEIVRIVPSMASSFKEARILTDIVMDYSNEISQMLDFFIRLDETTK